MEYCCGGCFTYHMNWNKLGKKGQALARGPVIEHYIEYLMMFFLLIGFFFALILNSAFLTYLSSILAGLFAGKVYHDKRRRDPILGPILIIIGFLLGFTLGSIRASRIGVFILFLAAAIFSNYAHKKGWIKYSKIKLFIR